MERRVRATEARVHFGTLIRQVMEQGDRVLVERAGRPQVVILSYEDYRRLQASAQHQEWRNALEEIGRLGETVWILREGESLPAPEDILRELREERLVQPAGLH
ncbi:MAG: type II toxin-antitoxin system Phd/YefM family antitoxin [Anaerolineae bacterium]